MSWWKGYWFAPAPHVDLAVVRILAVALQLVIQYALWSGGLERLAALPDDYYRPLPILNILHLPLGWGFRPDADLLQAVYYVSLAAGVFALLGLFTNLSLIVFTAACVYTQAFLFSFTDFHHPEAVMMIALSVLAISPSGRVLSLDWLRRRRKGESFAEVLELKGEFAGWPIRLVQWFFALMYISAVAMKMQSGGHDWMNGFTLQYYLIQDGLRWGSPLALWVAQYHYLILLAQYGVILFQGTFWLAVLFPKLRWVYVPAGLCLHLGILFTLNAPFYQWMVLYAVFIPWARAFQLLRQRVGFAGSRPPIHIGG
jgi:uncharacterized membrane protein YphA (DoxX/SURF4 family)